MDEPNKCSQSFGGDRSTNPPRPFFYVQPPLQPFYTYQWQMNHQHGPQNYSGAGYHLGRPYVFPYSYLQYPGYVLPHSAMHPVDYCRIYEQNLPHATNCDVMLQQHQDSSAGHRRTACAGAQTEPCDALNKLLECLDQLRAGDVSQTSGSSSPLTEEPECETKPMRRNLNDKRGLRSNGTEENPCWDRLQPQDYPERHLDSSAESGDEKNPEEPEVKVGEANEKWIDSVSTPVSHSSPVLNRNPEDINNMPKAADNSGDLPYCILHLPFQKVLSSGVCGSSITSPSFGSPMSYNYNPPKLAHERLSVLSASLDELSSHEELLSTDLDDMDLFPRQIYSRGRIPEVQRSHICKLCLLYPKRLRCTTCGSHSFTELGRTKSHYYRDMQKLNDVRHSHVTTKIPESCLRCAALKNQASKLLLKPRFRVKREGLKEKCEGSHENSCSTYFYCQNCMSSPEKSHKSKGASLQPEQRCRLTSDQLVWESSEGNSQVKSCKIPQVLQRQHRHRKSHFNPVLCSGSRTKNNSAVDDDDYDEEDEDVLQYHREKGGTKRDGSRC